MQNKDDQSQGVAEKSKDIEIRRDKMEKIRFIVGRHCTPQGSGSYHWRVPDSITFHVTIKVGDYAIVENEDGFTLVEIIAIGETSIQYERLLTRDSYGIRKRVLKIVPEEDLRELQVEAGDEE